MNQDNLVDAIDALGDGNTGSSPKSNKQQISQRIHWFFTYNNYEAEDIDAIDALFKEICTSWIFQEETGSNGTKHLQGVIRLKNKMRYTEFTPSRKIHWEPQRDFRATDYCQKLGTRSGEIRYGGAYKPKTELKLITPDRLFQQEILNIIDQEPDDRTVHWYWSDGGGIGKSSFAKYLIATRNCVFIDEGKKADIMKTIMDANMDRPKMTVVFDIPRANGNQISYKSIESIKNGMIYSPKYESGYKLFNAPHIIIFANSPPDMTKLSHDRWIINKLD